MSAKGANLWSRLWVITPLVLKVKQDVFLIFVESMADQVVAESSLKLSPSERHQMMSRWHSPNGRQLCRDRLLSRLKQNHEMRASIIDRMRKVNISDLDAQCEDANEDYVDEELQHIMITETDFNDMPADEWQRLAQEVKQEFLEEQNKSWEGLQTKEDQLRSQKFLDALQYRRAIICPYCKVVEMKTTDGYLICHSCNIRFATNLSVEQIIDRMFQILNFHAMSDCTDRFPQISMFQSNLVIYCHTCPLNHSVL